MKITKKFFLTIAMTMALGTSAFAASGFEFILNVPLGAGIGMPSQTLKDIGIKGGAGFDAGLTVQLGYMAQVTSGFGISALVELGYAHDSFVVKFGDTTGVNSEDYTITGPSLGLEMDSLQVGLLPKFNIGAFAIGIGGGIKFPLGGSIKSESANERIPFGAFMLFSPPVIGYVKATFDYSIFFTEKFALNVGLYLGGDIAKSILWDDGSGASGFNSFDIGVELGLKFGPRA